VRNLPLRLSGCEYVVGRVGRKQEGKGTMSEAAAGGWRNEAERRIIQRSIEDEAFRQRLI
jgi:hypothetical protein